MSVHVPVASSAASEVTWRSIRSDVVPRVLWGLPENIAADIRLVGPWRSLSGPCSGPLRTSTCMMTRQPSVQITWHPTSAALADIRLQRTMPLACGGARPSSSALRTEPASVPVSFRPPGCSPTTDLARFGSAVPRSRANRPVRHRQRRPHAHGRSQDISEISQFATSAGLTGWIPVLAGLCLGVCDRGVGGERLPEQGCGILSVRTVSRDGAVSHRDHCGLPPIPVWLRSRPANTAHAWVGGSGERS
jgi:hypothetical protein